jgi:hypothetical protein
MLAWLMVFDVCVDGSRLRRRGEHEVEDYYIQVNKSRGIICYARA